MQRIACVFVFIIFNFAGLNLWGSPLIGKSETVRVRIQSKLSKVLLSGLNIRLRGLEEKFSKVAIPQSKQVQISRVSIAGRSYWQISQGSSMDTKEVMSSQESLVVQGENLRNEALALPNQVLIKENEEGNIDVIGVVPLEEYVFSVLSSEMPLSWPLETLKAQAIAIRSYTRAILDERKNRTFHLESSVLDQVYKKVSPQQGNGFLEKAQRAVNETEGVILLNKRLRPLKAFYHSDCGGRTISAAAVWPQEKDHDAGVAVDPGCPANPMAKWSYRISKEKFTSLLKAFSGDIRSNEFRRILGFMNLRSTQFEMLEKEDDLEFVGKGFGHGVGLCQWGSRGLGLKGYSSERILRHYYPSASLKILTNQN